MCQGEGMAELIEMDAVELVLLIRKGNASPLEVKEATASSPHCLTSEDRFP